jgi:hypothetical protein
MYGLLQAAWAPTGNLLIYDDAKADNPNGAVPWARITVRHNAGGQNTISKQAGKSRYNRSGTLYVNLFAPPGDGLRSLDPLVKVVLDAFEGKTTSGQIWFSKISVRELGIVQGYYQINVLINFSYDEIK